MCDFCYPARPNAAATTSANTDLREWVARTTGVAVENVFVTEHMPKGVGMIIGDFRRFFKE